MALAKEVTKIICVADSSSSLQSKYFTISGMGTDFAQNDYYVWIDVGSGGTDPAISGRTGIEVDISADASNSTVATAVSNAIHAKADFSTAVVSATITVTNAVRGSVTDAANVNAGFTITTETAGTGTNTSSYNNPEDFIAWFINGDHLAIVTTKGSDTNTVHQREGDYKPIDINLINGLLIHYIGEPNAVSGINSTLDIDNTMHSFITDFVKCKLYMDRAGQLSISNPNGAAISMNLSTQHERKWKECLVKYGSKKRDKIGGSRRIMPPDIR